MRVLDRRHLIRSAVAGGAARLVTVGTSFVSVAITTRALGVEGYALYAVVTALGALLPFLDIGVGLGLVTELTRRSGEPVGQRQRVVASNYWFLWVLAGVSTCIGVMIACSPDLPAWLGMPTAGRSEVLLAVLVAVTALSLAMPTTVVFKVWLANHQSARVAHWQALTGPISVSLLAAAWALGSGVDTFVAITVLSPVLLASVASYYYFRTDGAPFRPRLSLVRPALVRGPISLGAVFGIQGLCMAGGLQADALVLAHFVSDQQLASYNIAFRMGAVFLGVMSAGFIPLWAAFGQAGSTGAWDDVRKTLRTATLVATALSLGYGVLLTALGGPLIRLWAGPHFVPSPLVLAAVAASVVAQTVALPLAMLMNGMGVRLFQIAPAVLMLLVNLTLSVALAQKIGPAGPAIASALAVASCLVLPNWFYFRRVLVVGTPPLGASG